MWFKVKRNAAPIYRDELQRRAFATASGRPKGAHKLKKLKKRDPERSKGLFGWLFRRRKHRSTDPER